MVYASDRTGEAGGLCGRGLSLIELLQHPRRLAGALQRVREKDRFATLSPAQIGPVFVHLVEQAQKQGKAALVADGNLLCEELAAMAGWCADRKVEMAVHLPPADLDALDGLASAALNGPEALDDCDGVLVIGDGFSTHPALGRPLLDWKYAHPRALFAVVDTHLSTTSRFANTRLTIAPGRHQEMLRWLGELLELRLTLEPLPLLQKLAGEAGIEVDGEAANFARQIQEVQRLAVALAPEVTKNADWYTAAVLAGKLAGKKNGGVLPLYSYGNALGAYRLLRHLGLRRVAELSGDLSSWAAVVEVGCDLHQTYPDELLRPLFDEETRRVVFAPLYTGQVESADLAIGLRLPGEVEGTIVDGSGREKRLGMMVAPPGAVAAGSFFEALLEKWVEGKALWRSLPEPVSRPESTQIPAAPPGDGAVQLLATATPIHFDDGVLTRQTGWTKYWQAEPAVVLAPATAARLGVGRDDQVELRQGDQTLQLDCQLCPSLPPGLALTSVHFPQVRRFLPWQREADRFRCPTPLVEISRSG